MGENNTACDADLPGWAARNNKPNLATWLVADPRATQEQLDAVTAQYAAACQVITDVAAQIGPDGMRGVLAVLSTSEGAYPGTTDPKLGAPNDWRAWLDAVDERGMLPAGKDHFSAMAGILVDYGVATPDALVGREEARSALDDLRVAAGYLALPAAVYDPMGGWDFPGATAAMHEVTATLADIDALSRMLPIAEIDNPLRARISTAETLPDLVGLHAQSTEQVETANAISDTVDRAFADQGPIAEVGLLGVDRQVLVDTAVADVGRLEFADARAQLAALEATTASAFSSGLMRIGGVAAAGRDGHRWRALGPSPESTGRRGRGGGRRPAGALRRGPGVADDHHRRPAGRGRRGSAVGTGRSRRTGRARQAEADQANEASRHRRIPPPTRPRATAPPPRRRPSRGSHDDPR